MNKFELLIVLCCCGAFFGKLSENLDFPLPYNGTYPTNYSYVGQFPDNFEWGLGTAAYQVEGGYNSGGRGASIWETFTGANSVGMPGSICTKAPCAINPAMIAKGGTGNIADNQYNLYKSDVKLMKKMGLKYYRFSISWSRIAPTGDVSQGVSSEGIAYYNNLINELIANGIQPFVTLYHWDLPQALFQPSKGLYGWYSTDSTSKPNYQMTPYFIAYAELCFKTFGDRVKSWITFNEPWTFCLQGSYIDAPNTPGYQQMDKWPYIAGHNVLNAHAKTVDLYRTKYKPTQKGRIAMTANEDWREPKTHLQADILAAERAVEFMIGWFTDPVYLGDYPQSMRQRVPLLPVFTPEESALVKGSNDFFGLNHYTTNWVVNGSCGAWCPEGAILSSEGFIQSESSWLFAVPWGLRKLLNWIKNRYNSPEIVITENGWSWPANTPQSQFNDDIRISYYANYTSQLLTAINVDKVNVTGYYGWSFLDNFEWVEAYTQRFGIVYSNYNFGYDPNSPMDQYNQPTTTQTRNRKKSSYWWQQVWQTNQLVDPAQFASNFFLNSTEILIEGLTKSGILWNNQWNLFQLCKNQTLKELLINQGLNNYISSTSTQKISKLQITEYQNYLQNLLKEMKVSSSNITEVASLIYNSTINQAPGGWLAFHIFHSLPNSTNIKYSLLLTNLQTSSSLTLFVGLASKTFSLSQNTLVVYSQLSFAGEEYSSVQNLLFQSQGQAQSTFDSILNYFFISGLASFDKMLGITYTLPTN